MSEHEDGRIADALVSFASDGRYPESEDISAARIASSVLPAAYRALDAAKIALQTDVRAISREVAPNVEVWMASAKALQADIEKSRQLAGDIVRNSEVDDNRIDSIQDQEAHLAFLEKEYAFNDVLRGAILSIKKINDMVSNAADLATQRKIVQSLQMLAESWKLFETLPAEPNSRVVRLLETRIHTLRKSIHEQFLDVWKALVHFDIEQSSLTINKSIQDEPMDLEAALLVALSYQELDKLAKQFWEDLDVLVIKPRTDVERGPLRKTKTSDNSIAIDEDSANQKIKPLFLELEAIFRTLSRCLPADFALLIADHMMPDLSKRILELWLDRAIPSSLEHMVAYQKTLSQVDDFTCMLISLEWPGFEPLQDWVLNAPKVWLSKKRETALDWTRNQLSLGLGESVPVQHVETRLVPRDEGLHIGTGGNVINHDGNVVSQDWESGWDSDAQDDPFQKEIGVSLGTNRASLEEEAKFTPTTPTPTTPITEDDAADAWGWGDEDIPNIDDNAEGPPQTASISQQSSLPRATTPALREVTLSESYYTSSIPKALFDVITSIYNDAEFLTKNEEIPVAIAAAGLFNLPTLVLAMYRAVSPHYYIRDPSGNMFMYNDSMWLCDQFKEYLVQWEGRDDRPKATYGMVKLDPEIKALRNFGKRAYTNEMMSQRTVITDLMGGAQSFLQTQRKEDLEAGIETVVSYIRSIATMWKKILPYSAWASAVGSLVNAVATKIVSDVFDLTGLDVDEAEQTAKLITTVSELDDLFIRENPQKCPKNGEANGDEDNAAIPLTPQFASNWMKMKFLSEVLQANLKDIRYLWFESHLSLYFTKDETMDLIRLSFEDNPNSRQLLREIKQSTVEMAD